jgi:hypothetical protein
MKNIGLLILSLILLTACPAEPEDDPADGETMDAPSPAVIAETPLPVAPRSASGLPADEIARAAYEEAYDNRGGGDWYRDGDNENAALAWGESWVMMSLAAMFRATGDPVYLERLAHHGDGVLAQRDDRRAVADYRGVSGACWRNLHYQDGDEPYCYAVHSGMIAYPLAEFARLVRDHGLGDRALPGGGTLGARAADYTAAARETAAFHDDQWRPDEGSYVFRADASFFDKPGSVVPLNMNAAMGRLLLVLHDLTGEERYRTQAEAIARRFESQWHVADDGAVLWNYGGGRYIPFGEDVPHASISVDFAVLAAARGVVFDAADLRGLATTFVARVAVDDRSLSARIGGGPRSRGAERSQCARWLRLSPSHAGIYAAVRDVYEQEFPPAEVQTGGTLLPWAYLAEFQPAPCESVDPGDGWAEDGEGTGWLSATGDVATLRLRPASPGVACAWALPIEVHKQVAVDRWDGEAFLPVASWQGTSGETVRHLTFDPSGGTPAAGEDVMVRLLISGRSRGGVRIRAAAQGPITPK